MMIATDFDDADVSRLNPDRNADRFDARGRYLWNLVLINEKFWVM